MNWLRIYIDPCIKYQYKLAKKTKQNKTKPKTNKQTKQNKKKASQYLNVWIIGGVYYVQVESIVYGLYLRQQAYFMSSTSVSENVLMCHSAARMLI